MNKILSLPEDLKQLKGVNYKKIKSCTFAKYTQTDTSHSTFVNVGSHLLTFVRKGYKFYTPHQKIIRLTLMKLCF